jgi:hypothetical protein
MTTKTSAAEDAVASPEAASPEAASPEAASPEAASPEAARSREAKRRSRAVEVQAAGLLWLGVLTAVLGVLVLVTLDDKLFAGLLTFGGAAVILAGLLRGAYGQYLYWRMATD